MTEDAKAAKARRLAEALRANLKRRKAAALEASGQGSSPGSGNGLGGVASRQPVEADDVAGSDGGKD